MFGDRAAPRPAGGAYSAVQEADLMGSLRGRKWVARKGQRGGEAPGVIPEHQFLDSPLPRCLQDFLGLPGLCCHFGIMPELVAVLVGV